MVIVVMTMVEEESRRRLAKGQHVLYGDASLNGRAPGAWEVSPSASSVEFAN